MHDLDRVSMQRTGELEGENFELEGHGEGEDEGEDEGEGLADGEAHAELQGEAPLQEGEVMELAAELLSVSHEQEVDQVLGDVVTMAANAIRGAVSSPVGQAIVGAIRPLVQAVLPVIGGGGGPVAGPAGAQAGRTQGNAESAALGLELEGLSQEDREFEVAKQLIRLASTAAAIAASAPPHIPPHVAARTALVEAAKQFAPGLVGRLQGFSGTRTSRGGPDSGAPLLGGARSGRWFRRGNTIILIGA